MQGHSFANTCQWFPRPKLEIPYTEPATLRRRGGAASAQSPRGIYDFPISPQSPSEGIMLSPPMKVAPMKTTPRSCVQDSIDQAPMCAQFSPGSNHPGHGFGDCNAQCGRNLCYRSPVSQFSSGSNFSSHGFGDCNAECSNNRNFCNRSPASPFFSSGENVLVRCNQTKWLVGQVRRTSSTNIKVWIGAADTLVNVPVELLPTHLARLDCPTPSSSPRDSPSAAESEIKARVQCVRPAHLSHRHLYQRISPAGSLTSTPQMRQTQYTSPAPRDPRLNYERPGHGFVPSNASTPPDLLELVVEQFEKKMPVPPPHSILKRSSDPLKPAREESIPPRPTFGAHRNYADFQAQYNWRQCLSQSSQEVNGPSYPRASALPMLNLNLNSEGAPTFSSPYTTGGQHCNCLHAKASILEGHDLLHSTQSPMHAPEGGCVECPLNKLQQHEQLLSLQVPKKTTSDIEEEISPKSQPPPCEIYIKGKEIHHKERLSSSSSWVEGRNGLRPVSRRSQGLPLERSISLDSFQSPLVPGLRDTRSPEAKPPKQSTFSAEPKWVTVIEKFGHCIRKL